MTDSDQPPPLDRLDELLRAGAHDEALKCLERLGAAETETRKRALRTIRDVAADRPRSMAELVDPISTFLTDEDRAVRLTTGSCSSRWRDQNRRSFCPPSMSSLTDWRTRKSSTTSGHDALKHSDTSPSMRPTR